MIMRKYSIVLFALLFTATIRCNSNKSRTEPQALLTTVKELNDYPSASGIEYLNDRIYVIGDDANILLVLDTALNITDSIRLFSFPGKRIPKEIKPDLESMTIAPDGRLLLFGSGSSSLRNSGWLINPESKRKDSIGLDTFYQRLSAYFIYVKNIEGITALQESYVLSNRGNKAFKKNYLIFTGNNFRDHQAEAKINTALVNFNSNSNDSLFSGISGMTYSSQTDALILTFSTEDTRNAIDDGSIGKSYLGIINSISAKKKENTIRPDKIIDLTEIDPRFKDHKIESVCIMNETQTQLCLLLAADNDNGSSTLFKLTVNKE